MARAYTLRLEGNKLEVAGVARAENAGIICTSPNGYFVYAANETRDFDDGLAGSGGGVTAFRVAVDGTLVKINDSLSFGSRPSSLCVSPDGAYLLASNHGSHSAVVCSYVPNGQGGWKLERRFDDASIACFALREDGGIGELRDLYVFDGCGYWNLGGGQSTSHLHCVRVTSSGLVYACNRGADTIEVLRLEADGKLSLVDRSTARRGYAPRHMAIDERRGCFYVCNENYPALTVFKARKDGSLYELQTLPTMDESYLAERPLPTFEREHCEPGERNTCCIVDPKTAGPADVHVSYDGRFVYVSNRFMYGGRGSIACFRVRMDDTLQMAGVWDLDGKDPRGFVTAPDRHQLLVGLLDKNEAVLLEADSQTGMIAHELGTFACPSPASFVWA